VEGRKGGERKERVGASGSLRRVVGQKGERGWSKVKVEMWWGGRGGGVEETRVDEKDVLRGEYVFGQRKEKRRGGGGEGCGGRGWMWSWCERWRGKGRRSGSRDEVELEESKRVGEGGGGEE